MFWRKMCGVLFAVVALGAIVSTSALAAPTTGNSFWYVGNPGVKLANGASRNVTCAKMGASNLILTSTVLGSTLELTATGIDCEEARITQNGSMAEDSGKLTFTGVTVMQPSGCKVPEMLTTTALKSRIEMDGTTTYDRFEPAAGATEKFLTIPITGCAAEGNYTVKGFVYGQANATGVTAVNQPVTFNALSNSVSGLTLGGNAATLTGEVTNTLEGEPEWEAKES